MSQSALNYENDAASLTPKMKDKLLNVFLFEMNKHGKQVEIENLDLIYHNILIEKDKVSSQNHTHFYSDNNFYEYAVWTEKEKENFYIYEFINLLDSEQISTSHYTIEVDKLVGLGQLELYQSHMKPVVDLYNIIKEITLTKRANKLETNLDNKRPSYSISKI